MDLDGNPCSVWSWVNDPGLSELPCKLKFGIPHCPRGQGLHLFWSSSYLQYQAHTVGSKARAES